MPTKLPIQFATLLLELTRRPSDNITLGIVATYSTE